MSNTQETIDFILKVGPPWGGQKVTTINYDPTKETLTYIFQPYDNSYGPQTFKLYDIWIPPSYMKILKFISIHFTPSGDSGHPMEGVNLIKYINNEIKTDVLSVRMQYNNMKKETELKNKERELEEKDKLLKNKERDLEEKEIVLKNKEKELKNKEKELEEKDKLLKILKEEFEEKLEYKEIELTIIKEEFEEKEIGLKNKDKILKSKEKELRKKDDIVETLKEELEEKNEKIVKLKKIIRELESDNEILEIKNGKFKQKLAELEN